MSSGVGFITRGSGLSVEYEIPEWSFTLLFLHKLTILETFKKNIFRSFLGDPVVRSLPCDARDTG